MNISRILVEVDPRKDNRPALARAEAVAEHFGAALEILACESLPPLAGSTIVDASVVDSAREEFMSDLAEWAGELARPLRDAGIDVGIETAWQEPRYRTIAERGQEIGADLVIRVASKHGRFQRMFLGATDWELIRHVKQPLWLVQKEDARAKDLNLLAAVDPTHPDDEAMALDSRILDTAQTLGEAAGGAVHVYHAIPATSVAAPFPAGGETLAPPMPEFRPEFSDKVRTLHREKLDSLLESTDIDEKRVHVVDGDPAQAIGDVIGDHDIDVVVAGAISRSWLERLLIGSTAESLFNAIDCDLLVVRAETDEVDDDS